MDVVLKDILNYEYGKFIQYNQYKFYVVCYLIYFFINGFGVFKKEVDFVLEVIEGVVLKVLEGYLVVCNI